MAVRSGSNQTLKIGPAGGSVVTVACPGDDSGFAGLNMSFANSTFENKSGGLTTTKNAGTTVISGDFSVAENTTTLPLLLDGNGQRFDVDWEPETGADGQQFEAIFIVSHSMEDRGKRMFSVTFTVDGPITVG